MMFIKSNQRNFTVKRMCAALGVSEAGYYRWSKRPPSRRSISDQILLQAICEVYESSKQRYGSPKIWRQLQLRGFICGHNRVERLMRVHGIRAKVVKKRKPWIGSVRKENAAENILNRNFSASAANKVWVTDITYIKATCGWLYLCVFLDLYSRKVVGWSISNSPDSGLVLNALFVALKREKPDSGLIIHSDQGVQYGSNAYRSILKTNHFIQSMSRRGNCWDNACVESFFSRIKAETLNDERINNINHLYEIVYRYIEIFYNRIRIHSSLGYMSPVQFENTESA